MLAGAPRPLPNHGVNRKRKHAPGNAASTLNFGGRGGEERGGPSPEARDTQVKRETTCDNSASNRRKHRDSRTRTYQQAIIQLTNHQQDRETERRQRGARFLVLGLGRARAFREAGPGAGERGGAGRDEAGRRGARGGAGGRCGAGRGGAGAGAKRGGAGRGVGRGGPGRAVAGGLMGRQCDTSAIPVRYSVRYSVRYPVRYSRDTGTNISAHFS